MQYVRIEDEAFGFIDDRIHKILKTDIAITNEEYIKFLELQSKGDQFRLKKIRDKSSSFFDLIEPFKPEKKEDAKTTITDLSNQLQLLLKKASQIEQKINQYKEG